MNLRIIMLSMIEVLNEKRGYEAGITLDTSIVQDYVAKWKESRIKKHEKLSKLTNSGKYALEWVQLVIFILQTSKLNWWSLNQKRQCVH